MTDFMNNLIWHARACDEMDESMDIVENTYSYEDFLGQPIKCAIHQEPEPDARCISSDTHGTNLSSQSIRSITNHHSDITNDYDIYPTILGTGNYGCVRECLHRDSCEMYAVKTIEKSKVARLDHIRREIELLRAVDHPSIMNMVDWYENDMYVHIVTEKYTGGELFDKIIENTTDSGCMNEHEAAKIIKSIIEAVGYLHENDVVHRDIKPENILFESDEEGCSTVKLIDFGLSRKHGLHDHAMCNQVGTPYYMSPDVLRGKYDRSCDLWSIGVMTYILLCGYPPFNGANDAAVHDSIRKGDLVFERGVWANLSKTSRDFVSKLLSTDSSKIGSAAEALHHPWVSCA